jgi:hypothetical protein
MSSSKRWSAKREEWRVVDQGSSGEIVGEGDASPDPSEQRGNSSIPHDMPRFSDQERNTMFHGSSGLQPREEEDEGMQNIRPASSRRAAVKRNSGPSMQEMMRPSSREDLGDAPLPSEGGGGGVGRLPARVAAARQERFDYHTPPQRRRLQESASSGALFL